MSQNNEPVIGQLIPVKFKLQQEPLIVRCQFNVNNYYDALFQQYGISMPNQLQQSVSKRRCEYLAGRVLFQKLLQHYDLPHCQLLNNSAGDPTWPLGYVGSISHADNNAICCLMPDKVIQAVGIDIETVLNTESCAELTPHILQPEEQRLLHCLSTIDYAELLTITFSAKESLYKALYPQVQRFFGFEEAVITAIQPDKQTFTLCLTSELTPQLTAGRLFHGHYRFLAQQVISLITLPSF